MKTEIREHIRAAILEVSQEDNLTLEKYRRADEAKIKELTLQIEKLTVEVAKKANELEKEVTET